MEVGKRGLVLPPSGMMKRLRRGDLIDELEDEEDYDEDVGSRDRDYSRAIMYGDDGRGDVSDRPGVKKPSIRQGDMTSGLPKTLELGQKIYLVPVNKPGLIQIRRIHDQDGLLFRLGAGMGNGGGEDYALVIECPSQGVILPPGGAEGRTDEDKKKWPVIGLKGLKKKVGAEDLEKRCVGDEDVVDMLIKGVGSMQVDWSISERGNNKKEQKGTIDGIESSSSLENRGLLSALENSDSLVKQDQALDLFHKYHSPKHTRAQSHTVSLPVAHDTPGIYDVSLHTIRDSYYNELKFDSLATTGHTTRSFQVYSRPTVSFSTKCSQTNPLKLQYGQKIGLPILTVKRDMEDPKLLAKIHYEPLPGGGGEGDKTKDTPWTREIDLTGNSGSKTGINYDVDRPGTYTIEHVEGEFCQGVVREPSVCIVEGIPLPSAMVRMESLPGW